MKQDLLERAAQVVLDYYPVRSVVAHELAARIRSLDPVKEAPKEINADYNQGWSEAVAWYTARGRFK